ncbi:MAG: protease propeptide/inhibitor [Benniella sp.]|nr:MAG: protease propeptide/inhibitor [Benniella sp.]
MTSKWRPFLAIQPRVRHFSSRKIVIFKDNTPQSEIDEAVRQVESSGGRITQRYNTLMLGFAATFPEAEASINALNALNSHPQLDYMEDDGVVRTQ